MLRLGEFVEMLSNHASKHWGENKDEKNQLINQSSTPCLFYFFPLFLSVMLFPCVLPLTRYSLSFSLLLVSVCTSTAAILQAEEKTFFWKKINTFLDTHKIQLYCINFYAWIRIWEIFCIDAWCIMYVLHLRLPGSFTHIIMPICQSLILSISFIPSFTIPIYKLSRSI